MSDNTDPAHDLFIHHITCEANSRRDRGRFDRWPGHVKSNPPKSSSRPLELRLLPLSTLPWVLLPPNNCSPPPVAEVEAAVFVLDVDDGDIGGAAAAGALGSDSAADELPPSVVPLAPAAATCGGGGCCSRSSRA